MGKITFFMEDKVEKRLRAAAIDEADLNRIVNLATAQWVENIEQEEIRRKALKLLRKGFKMGKILYKHRSELHDRRKKENN